MNSAFNLWFNKIRSSLYRLALAASARYRDDALSLQAMSLTYTTLLSLVPFLAVAFSVLRAFDVHNFLEPFVVELLQPIGPNAPELTDRIIKFVENIRVGILGGVGLAALFYTVVTLVSSMEDALNQIWRSPRSRSWGQRITAYLSIVLVGPVMVFTAFALTASAQSYWLITWLTELKWVSQLFTLITSVMPFILLCATFSFLYKVLPYTNVRLRSALVGGAAAAILWQLVGTGFAAFVATSTRYAAIYSSFAVVIVFLIWLYIAWLIFLVGGEVAYCHQHPHAFVRESLDRSKHLFREWLALASLAEIARRHIAGTRPWEAEELAAFLGVSSLGNLVEEFVSAGILLRAAEPEGIALARPPETVTVKEILDIVTGTDIEEMKTAGPVADALIHRDQAVQKALEGMTLKSLGAEPQAKTLRFAQFPAR